MQVTLDIAEGTLDNCTWLTNEQADAIFRVLRAGLSNDRRQTRQRRFKRKIVDLVRNPWNKWDVSSPIIYKFDGKHGRSLGQAAPLQETVFPFGK